VGVYKYVKQFKFNIMKTINEKQARLSKVSKDAKNLQRSLGATRSFLLEYQKELELTNYEIKYLLATKKDAKKYEELKSSVQFVKGTEKTCVYWLVRTLQKFEKENK
jgi:septal ring factor EnvC (AmiA/AmiB activator)